MYDKIPYRPIVMPVCAFKGLIVTQVIQKLQYKKGTLYSHIHVFLDTWRTYHWYPIYTVLAKINTTSTKLLLSINWINYGWLFACLFEYACCIKITD
jgi:hypothetical protein